MPLPIWTDSSSCPTESSRWQAGRNCLPTPERPDFNRSVSESASLISWPIARLAAWIRC